jgi:hypothetical protein
MPLRLRARFEFGTSVPAMRAGNATTRSESPSFDPARSLFGDYHLRFGVGEIAQLGARLGEISSPDRASLLRLHGRRSFMN